jgi:hypothetical protein
MGWWPLGCAQHLFATNVRAEGSEPYSSAFVKALGLTLVFPTLTSAIATTSATAAQAMSPLNTIAHCVFACYGMAHRQEMRRRFHIRGTDCCCDCCACACDGNSEKTDDFCVYLWCAICQEARHVRRYSLGVRARRGGGGGGATGGSGYGPVGGAHGAMDVPVATVIRQGNISPGNTSKNA